MVITEEQQSTGSTVKHVIKFPPAIGDWTVLRPQKQQAKKVRRGLYHFDRLSEPELHQGHLLHYHLMDALLLHWKSTLSMGTEFYQISAEQLPYLDFLETIVSPVVQHTVHFGDRRLNGALFMDLHLANSLIQRGLGFRDLSGSTSRSLTDAEMIILKTIWAAQKEIVGSPAQIDVTGSPNFTPDHTVGAMSTYVIFEAEVVLGDSSAGKIGFGYLAGTLRHLLEKVEFKQKSSPMRIWLPGSLLGQMTAKVEVQLGSTTISAAELKNLEVGDVLVLDREVNQSLPVLVGNYEVLQGTPGLKDDQLAVRCFQKTTSEIPFEPIVRETQDAGTGESQPLADDGSENGVGDDLKKEDLEEITEEYDDEKETEGEEEEEEKEELEDLGDEAENEGEGENPFKF